MSFIVSAVLLAKICSTDVDCRVDEVARFGNGEIGEAFCTGTAAAINQADGGQNGTYFCASPVAAETLLKAKRACP